jgi:hypothetical protein
VRDSITALSRLLLAAFGLNQNAVFKNASKPSTVLHHCLRCRFIFTFWQVFAVHASLQLARLRCAFKRFAPVMPCIGAGISEGSCGCIRPTRLDGG